MTDPIRRRRDTLRIACCASLLTASAYACGGSDTPTDPGGTRGVRVVSGAGQTDTITAKLRQPLVVEIRDSTGRLLPGQLVTFKTVRDTLGREVYVWPTGQAQAGYFATYTTDAQGRATMVVQLGGGVGTARLEVAVPELALADTVTFTVTHGGPFGLVVAPRDTSLLAGGSFTPRVAVVDRYGNPIPEAAPTFSATTGVSVTSAGKITAASALVRARVNVTYRTLADTVNVSVIPLFPLVLNYRGSAVLVNTDGTGRTTLMGSADASIAPSAVPSTSSVVYYMGNPAFDSKVWVVQPNGTPRRLLSGSTDADAWPRLSPDGAWVYFVRNLNTLWRARIDGTGLDSLASFRPEHVYSTPTVSPDGRTVAIEDGIGLLIVDVATKASSHLSVGCGYPSYSPDGAFFACASTTELAIMRTDGTGQRSVVIFPSLGPSGLSGVDWTPDGKWLLAIVGRYANLYDVTTGSALPLSGLGIDFSQASFVR